MEIQQKKLKQVSTESLKPKSLRHFTTKQYFHRMPKIVHQSLHCGMQNLCQKFHDSDVLCKEKFSEEN